MPFDPNTFASPAPGQRYSLPAIARAQNPGRKRDAVFRPIVPTNALASDLFTRCYKPLITAMQTAIPAIVAAYERGLPVRDALITDSTDQAQQQTETMGQQLQRLVLALLPGLSDWSIRVDRWHQGQFKGAALAATGVNLDTVLIGSGTPQSVGEYVAWNTALMKDVGQQAQQKMSAAIFSAFQARQPATDLARDLRDIVGLSRARSLRIASDQLGKLSSALDTERMDEAGITEFKWRHSGKVHYRPWHRARDGKNYDLKTGEEVGGGDTIAADDMPGLPPFCGCRKQAVVRFN